MTYKAAYIDNQGKLRLVQNITASTFSDALSVVESEANESGHGISQVCVMVKG